MNIDASMPNLRERSRYYSLSQLKLARGFNQEFKLIEISNIIYIEQKEIDLIFTKLTITRFLLYIYLLSTYNYYY